MLVKEKRLCIEKEKKQTLRMSEKARKRKS
jgi:hypothetical protein